MSNRSIAATVVILLVTAVVGFYAHTEFQHKRAIRKVIALNDSASNLLRIAKAIETYGEFHESDSANSLLTSSDGVGSWRVRLLPFIQDEVTAQSKNELVASELGASPTPPVFASPFREMPPDTSLTSVFLVNLDADEMRLVRAPVVDRGQSLIVVDSATCVELWYAREVDTAMKTTVREILDSGSGGTLLLADLHGNVWRHPRRTFLDPAVRDKQ